ncbi:MAG: hypothetical protein ABI632_00035 [Pseudolysinimonas sp.]
MNNILSTAPGRHTHPPELSFEDNPVRRVGVIDRVALHLGVALIKWGRRPRTLASRERRASRVEQRLAQLERERVNARSLRLLLPPR